MKTNIEELCKKYDFAALFAKKNYAFFTKGYYNLNIIGIRKSNKQSTNTFEDCLVVIYNTPTKTNCRKIYSITTKPGLTVLNKPINAKGTAILVPGQYRGCWKLGMHRGKYQALVQNKPVKVYRDNNKDNIFDLNPETIDKGCFGINIHRAGEESILVNGWSAGCQVFRVRKDFESFMTLVRSQINNGHGSNFTYTLINEKDLYND